MRVHPPQGGLSASIKRRLEIGDGGSGVVNGFEEVVSKSESVGAHNAVAESSDIVFNLASPCD
ncbi:hypothetical protein F2Q69_00047646 [Brassica cretica]|uniref:Uncharacterized protein n=1 Tax=Brassica cretica TaxID=69181 RepID=A0A8S9Q051_BRACR|nr:hypothetical protein F2Q69_00047646 [Brassica cretica]